MNGEIVSFGQIISSAFENIKIENAENSITVYNEWKNILCRIKSKSDNSSEGMNLASHSRVIDIKNGLLIAEADHPGWIELLQLHKKYILNGLHMKFPELNIKNIVFRLKGTYGDFSSAKKENEQEIQEKIKLRIEREEEMLKKSGIDTSYSQKSSEKKEIPPELKALFDDLKQSMLTNTE